MRYVIKERFWTWGDEFYIYDENQNPIYFVDGEAFSWGDKLSFQDLNGNELAFISQTLFTWMPRYEIFRDSEKFAEVVKEFSWFNKKFTMDVPGPNDYTIDGSFWQHDYQFVRSGRVVAQIRKEYWTWTDTYGIETFEGADDISVLCAAIVIDQVLHDERRNN